MQPHFLRLLPDEVAQRFAQIARHEAGNARSGLAQWSTAAARKRQNMRRNRYSNVFPYEWNRIRLDAAKPHSDYINASFVDIGKCYIAAQGPTGTTAHHFWAMCHQQAQEKQCDSVIVVMVTPLVEGGMEKCAKYWPDPGTEVHFEGDGLGSVTVRNNGQEAHDSFLLSRMTLESGGTVKEVLHFHHSQWADMAVPDSDVPLMRLLEAVDAARGATGAVPVVHCSAGVGRTGTFIAINYLKGVLTQVPDAESDPVFNTVVLLRDCRMMMVQTPAQYQFVYDTVKRFRSETPAT